MKHLAYIILMAFFCMACAQQPKYSVEELALRKDIGQMLLVGFRGTEYSDTMHIVRDIKEYSIGGVILFEYDVPSQSRSRNVSSPEQLRELCKALQHVSSETLLISIDQEGGNVNRLKQRYGFPHFASAQQQSHNDSVRYYARLTAQTLHSMGINLNFAPCVDFNTNPSCPIIGKIGRSFGKDPNRVSECAQIWMEEQWNQGVISCLKHFPGHGSSKSDTHKGLADVTDTWSSEELTPYIQLISNAKEPLMVMTTHVFNGKIDTLYPATLSAKTLTQLLRDSLHYEGVIITDDLAMGAMVQEYSAEEMLTLTINAGANMLCLSNNGQQYNPNIVPETVDLIFRLVKEGKIDAALIHDSARRIRALKQTLH